MAMTGRNSRDLVTRYTRVRGLCGGGFRKELADLGALIEAIIRASGLQQALKEFGIREGNLDGFAEHSLRGS
ncbi:hypothetical protein F5X98DRAFT_378989 [Xylaria grammica]|nr:hypothetical protein F5X98DRAFT_378989 [Xylaria grammica]